MYAVGRLGSYITQGVYTVSGPFHPFGGAVDIIVVEQQDGTFKSSPWYVRFGKFQGVLKSKEKVVDISVDGVHSDFHMYLDQRGQAYFLREVECEEGESLFYPSSSGEDADVAVLDRRPLKSKSSNYDSPPLDSVENVKMVTRTRSRRSRLLGLVFGSNPMKENSFRTEEEEELSCVVRADSLERAEIAADLLEMKWSTNLAFSRHKKDNSPKIFNSDILVSENKEDSQVPSIKDENGEEIVIDPNETETKSRLRFQKMGSSNEDIGVEMSSLNEVKEENSVLDSPINRAIDELVSTNVDNEKLVKPFISETINMRNSPTKSEVISVNETGLLVGKNALDPLAILVNNSFEEIVRDKSPHDETTLHSFANGILMETCTGATKVDPNIVSEITSDFENSPTRETVNIIPNEGINVSPSQSSEEEILLFGEMDDLIYNKDVASICSTHIVEDNSSLDKTINRDEDVNENPRVVLSSIIIPKEDKIDNFRRMAESLPNMWPPISDVVLENHQLPLPHSLGSTLEVSKKNASLEYLSSRIKLDAEKDDEVAQPSIEGSQTIEYLDNAPPSMPVGNEFKATDLSKGKWRVWPFSFRRTKSMNNTDKMRTSKSFDKEINENKICTEEKKDDFKTNAKKTKKVKVLTPTPEQLASLKLKDGVNTVTFTFSTQMLGPQQVDARIFLWKWDTRIVISDVDGTITKSDVLGQFMPMVGMDWSHIGVTHLYSAIKENGYQLLFLSARAISQAYHTRQFLLNLKQDGKALPNGPVVISPDGLFPSLFREVIRRAPHEFKIACLEDIKALFPPDRSPFYAGFGNRDTDEVSYLKVGIPKGKIFIINPKGEVVVNRRVDRKSYTSLKALVHDMFPPMSSSEQEDYNSWNFWKLPPPLMDV